MTRILEKTLNEGNENEQQIITRTCVCLDIKRLFCLVGSLVRQLALLLNHDGTVINRSSTRISSARGTDVIFSPFLNQTFDIQLKSPAIFNDLKFFHPRLFKYCTLKQTATCVVDYSQTKRQNKIFFLQHFFFY